MRRAVLATVVVNALLCATAIAPTVGSASTSRAERALADGFRVARGTRLLGAVLPAVPNPPSTESRGWTALLWVDTDAATATRAYAEQAARLGYREALGKVASCRRDRAPQGLLHGGLRIPAPQPYPNTQGLRCQADYWNLDGGFSILVWVCKRCVHPTAEAQLRLQRRPPGIATDPDGFLAATRPITVLPAHTPTARLSAAEQARARRAQPGVGERFSRDLEVSELPRLVRGAAPLAPALSFQRCDTGDQEAVVRIRSNVDDVVDAFLRQSNERTKGQVAPPTVVDGVTVTWYRYGYYTGLVVVDDPRARDPVAIFEWCND